MFVSFFPRPKPFFLSALIWMIAVTAAWYAGASEWGYALGLPRPPEQPIISPAYFITGDFIWFYAYFAVATAIFAVAWRMLDPTPWWRWSVLGSALIIFNTYFLVQADVAINNWFGQFYDIIQAALGKTRVVTPGEYYGSTWGFLSIALVYIVVVVLNSFFVSHWVFRWRTAMNDYYMSHWDRLRTVEGASQRVQEDTKRFSSTLEGLGVSLLDSVMTLIAFLPLLVSLSTHVKELPLVGEVSQPLVTAAILWSLLGTVVLAVVGIRLPGLEFKNQRAEAAYRKELVFGEEDPNRADPPTIKELFGAVRRNYFRLFFNYTYFNVVRYLYLQTDAIVAYLLLGPTIIAGAITLGTMQQIIRAFGRVRSSFQYLVQSWPTIVELQSVYQRLRTFEALIHRDELPDAELRYQAKAD